MRALVTILASVAVVGVCEARIITVDDDGPADFNNIQAAVDDANDGDTVLVADGTYTGRGNRDIDFLGKAITVRSTDPNDLAVVAATVIDCQGSEADPHRGFSFRSGEDANSVLAGLTITNGHAPLDLIRGHYTGEVGGGIYLWASGPTITNCIIRSNYAGSGGGICCCEGSAPRIAGCRITDNTAMGGGIYCQYSSPEITNCLIANNVAPWFSGFPGSFASDGGGIYCAGNNATVSNCTIVYNRATAWGGAMYGATFLLSNSIVWNNHARDYDEIYGFAVVAYSDVKGGYSGTGNINADPFFANAAGGDYHLKSQAGRWEPNSQTWVIDSVTSPCIDAGDPMTPIGDEPFPNGGRVNMGAYGGTIEASKSYFGRPPCETVIAGDVNGDCIVDFKDMSITLLHWLQEG